MLTLLLQCISSIRLLNLLGWKRLFNGIRSCLRPPSEDVHRPAALSVNSLNAVVVPPYPLGVTRERFTDGSAALAARGTSIDFAEAVRNQWCNSELE